MSTPANILVTVLLPVYNAQDYILESLQSVLDQTYAELEILVINDGSTDSSVEVIETMNDPRIRLEHNEQNLGLIATLNKGIELAKGKYIVRADADDRCLPNRVEKQVPFMEAHPEIGISGSAFGNFGEDYEYTIRSFSSDHDEIMFRHLYQIHLMHGTSIWRKSVFLENQLRFDSTFTHAEDYDLFDRLAQLCKVANLQDCLYDVRMHPGRVSFRFSDIQNENSNRVRRRGFERMGVNVSDEQLKMFIDFSHRDFRALLGKEREVADLLLAMLEGNAKTKYIGQDVLVKNLMEGWEPLCLSNSNESKDIQPLVRDHGVSRYLTLSRISKLKIFAKKILK